LRWSETFIPTLREMPAEAETVSHQLLLRAGYIRQVAAGIYSYLPLAQRSVLKISQIIREEMNRVGGQEFFLPVLHPRELWEESGRWEIMGDNMFRLKDRAGRDLCLGMTHEEVITDIARHELRSYKQLPQTWYQIQTKFRDEARPKGGLLRVRQFTMKDAYSFHTSWESLDETYQQQYGAYSRIYDRCGLRYIAVKADTGAMGGKDSHEFSALIDAGEDLIVHCEHCGYGANREMAISRASAVGDQAAPDRPEKFPTPGIRTIAALETYPGGAEARRQIKTLIYMVDEQPVLVCVRGDHTVNEAALARLFGAEARFYPAHPDQIVAAMGANAGSLGPVGVSRYRTVVDEALRGRKNLTTGANEDDFHIRGVVVDRDFKGEYQQVRLVEEGDLCFNCGHPIKMWKGLEVGQIFKLGIRYSQIMKATVLNEKGEAVPMIMGCYGIGVERILAAAIEQNHDENGMILPASISPFSVIVTVVNMGDVDSVGAGERISAALEAAGIDVLLDDRDERPGVKFKDNDLIGVPLRVTLGPKKLKEGKAEIYTRATRESVDVALDEVVARVQALLKASTPPTKE
jgi:prolyl-tRNA synthetase